ncbi:MAG: putative Ig domain-containing protein [Burkholderiales bacterium]|nr:putative Ig domain-containing protein [Burkholderiales bacterium]
MRKLFRFLALSAVMAVAACGGGGGSPGDTSLPYTIKLTTAKKQLPINLVNEYPSTGAYARFTTTLYVEAREGNAPIQGGEDIFSCNVAGGLDSGALYYLDGKDEHMVEVDDGKGGKIKIPGAYRSIVLGANAGGNSFHFHAGNKAGTARITCSVTNPADKQVSSASVDIVVGAQTGQPANVIATAQAPGYLGTQGNTQDLRNNVAISALVMDDANQPILDPSAANLQVTIRPFGASAGARLLAGSQSGTTVQVKTIGGEGQFSLSSGPSAGVVLLELTTDRYDNNVSNGIQDPVTQLKVVTVHKAVRTVPLTIVDSAISVVNGLPFTYALTAQGGVPPYEWSATGLPTGLTMSADGVITGTPTAPKGDYVVVVTVTDEAGSPVSKNITIKVTGELAIDGCTSDVGKPCALPAGKVLEGYSYTLSFSIGDPSVPVTWSIVGVLPPGLTLDTATGVISGTPTTAGSYTFVLTATRGSLRVSRQVQIVIAAP